jgi:hypothetical protein
MTTADDLDRHMRETADMARAAMADMLCTVALCARRTPAAAALAATSSLAGTVARMDNALTATRASLGTGETDIASLDAARVMTLSDYASKLARLRTIAAQMAAYDEAQSGSAS